MVVETYIEKQWRCVQKTSSKKHFKLFKGNSFYQKEDIICGLLKNFNRFNFLPTFLKHVIILVDSLLWKNGILRENRQIFKDIGKNSNVEQKNRKYTKPSGKIQQTCKRIVPFKAVATYPP